MYYVVHTNRKIWWDLELVSFKAVSPICLWAAIMRQKKKIKEVITWKPNKHWCDTKNVLPSQTARSSIRWLMSVSVSSVSLSTTVPFCWSESVTPSVPTKKKTYPKQHSDQMKKTNNGSHLWIIEESKWSRICAEEIPNRFIVNLHGRELQHKFTFLMLKYRQELKVHFRVRSARFW